jgi:hypothetical protein
MKIRVPLASDEEGMVGRQCPHEECKKYFKVRTEEFSAFTDDKFSCPYCGITAHPRDFLTQNQLEYVKSVAVRQVLGPSLDELKSLEREPDSNTFFSIGVKVDITGLDVAQYFEKESRRNIHCNTCNRSYSVYGVSYYCPFCGQRDPFAVYQENVETIRRILRLEETLSDDEELVRTGKVQKLEEEGVFDTLTEKMLDMTVTAFETYCKCKYASKMAELRPGSSYQEWLKRAGNRFQNLENAEHLLQQDLEYSIDANMLLNDRNAISKAFQKRHVLIHSSGIIDERYVKATGENSTQIGTRVQVKRDEVEDILSSLTRLVEKVEHDLQIEQRLTEKQ